MRAYGGDRMEALGDGRVALVCREPKGWKTREKSKWRHRADHPGTAILWGNIHWEVVTLEWRAEGGVRYVLAPWDDQNVFRGMESYDEVAELARAERRQAESRAESQRSVLILLAPLAGLLPEEDQIALELRLAVPAWRMTFVSAVLLLMFGTYSIVMLVASGLGGAATGLPTKVLLLGDYLFIESFARLVVVLSQSRPIGSALTLPWLFVKAIREPKRPDLSRTPDARDVREERERTYHTLQPVLGLLPAAEQRVLAERFGFDALSWGRTTARVLLGIGLLFGGSALLNIVCGIGTFGDVLWLAAGALLVAEQRGRLERIRGGAPAGSVLGRLVGSMSRPLVAPEPPGERGGETG